jgi:hypothetical protein
MTAAAQKIHPLDLLYIRSCTLAERVCAGTLPFIDAVDMAYSAAEWAGLCDSHGDDAVQAELAAAFMFMQVPKVATCRA